MIVEIIKGTSTARVGRYWVDPEVAKYVKSLESKLEEAEELTQFQIEENIVLEKMLEMAKQIIRKGFQGAEERKFFELLTQLKDAKAH